ncbi:MAG TPA: aldose 1-epimerase family protein [Candidatus Dormibacteraeota bacterium]|nr:aldose 1-epimerase family protein [Candidatus Dormibacteraeota bacterium]
MADRLVASGDQVELIAGDTRLVVVTVGGGMRELTREGWDVLDGYPADEMAPGAAGQPLIPWPNRLADGRYEFDGKTYQAPLTEPERHNALHGFARWLTWRVEEHERARAVLGLDMYPRPGYPFALRLRIEYTVREESVSVATTALNADHSRLPYANGFHPYVSAGTAGIDECVLELPAATWYEVDERLIPTGKRSVDGTAYDFRTPRAIGPEHIDLAFTDLARDADGKARVRLASPDRSRTVALWMDDAYRYVMAFTGDTLSDRARRRRALGIEPMTAAPNAFQTGDGLHVLAPGETLRTEWGLEFG